MTRPTFDKAECIGASTIYVGGCIVSRLLIGCVAIDRLLAILKPMMYRGVNYFKCAVYCSLASLIFSLVCLVLMFLGVELSANTAACNAGAVWTQAFRGFFTAFNLLLGISVTSVSVATIYMLRKKVRAVGTSTSAAPNQPRKQAKATNTISIVLGVYILCYVLPRVAFCIAEYIIKSGGSGGSVLGRIGPYIGIGTLIVSASNVFIYSLKMKDFRICLVKLCKCQKDGVPPSYRKRSLPEFHLPTIPEFST